MRYSRIIQQVGKDLEESKVIKPNIFNNEIILEAKTDYYLQNDTVHTLVWSQDSIDQLNIKLFKSKDYIIKLKSY